jgi:outer membrane immunogenic protein
MKQLFLGTVAMAVLATAASAADVTPRYVKTAAIDPAYNWSGLYLGLNAGAASRDVNFVAVAEGVGFSDTHTYSDAAGKTGFLGGGQIGYNYQTGTSVLGVEATLHG